MAQMYMMQKNPHDFHNRLLLSSDKDYRALEKQQQKADKRGDTAKSKELAAQLREMEVKAHTDRHEAQREMAGALLRTGAMVGTGIGVTMATGGVGLGPYLAGMSAASAVSMGLDPEVRTLLRAGDYPGALNHSSYHLPFVGAGRNSWDAWQTGHPWQAAGHAGLLGVEVFGLRGIGKLSGAGKVRGTVLKRVGAKAAKAKKAAKVSKQGKVEGANFELLNGEIVAIQLYLSDVNIFTFYNDGDEGHYSFSVPCRAPRLLFGNISWRELYIPPSM